MRNASLLFFFIVFYGFANSQELRPCYKDIASSILRSADFNKKHFGIDSLDFIKVGDTIAYVREDGKVLLIPVEEKGDSQWHLIRDALVEDSLIVRGTYDLEASFALIAKMDTILAICSDIKENFGNATLVFQDLNKSPKPGDVSLAQEKYNYYIAYAIGLIIFISLLFHLFSRYMVKT